MLQSRLNAQQNPIPGNRSLFLALNKHSSVSSGGPHSDLQQAGYSVQRKGCPSTLFRASHSPEVDIDIMAYPRN